MELTYPRIHLGEYHIRLLNLMLILVRLYVSVDLARMSRLSIPPFPALALEHPSAVHFILPESLAAPPKRSIVR
jgi:hypothetical protein